MGRTLKLLLDTQVIYWLFFERKRLGSKVQAAISEAEAVYVSLVSFWEIAIKVRAGKMDAGVLLANGPDALVSFGYKSLGIEYRHIATTMSLSLHHRDPFDRLLIAQAKVERLTIVSRDKTFDRYEVKRIW